MKTLEAILRRLENKAKDCENNSRFLGERAAIHRANGHEDAWAEAHNMGGFWWERGRVFREAMAEVQKVVEVEQMRESMLHGRTVEEAFEAGDRIIAKQTEWKQGELEADADILEGRIHKFDSVEDLISWLDE